MHDGVNAMPTVDTSSLAPGETADSVYIRLYYMLDSGYEIRREYYIWMDSEEGELVKQFASSVEGVIGYWEKEILETRQQLMDESWGPASETETHTVDVHIGRLRDRLRENPDLEIATVRGLGYKVVRRNG